MLKQKAGATYISNTRGTRHARRSLLSILAPLVAAFVAILVLASVLVIPVQAAFAEEEKTPGIDAIEALVPEELESEESASYFFELINGGNDGRTDRFANVIWQMFGVRYMNIVDDAVVSSSTAETAARLGLSNPGSSKYMCRTNQLGAGTPYYHNCDIPNLMTEFFQDVFSTFDETGIQNAEAVPVNSGFLPGLGVPKNLPGSGKIPIPVGGANKYTALELYGYDLPWTTYLGEWDHIKTVSQARLLTNFGFFDHVGLTGQAIGTSISNGLAVGVDNFNQMKSTGGIFAAIGGFFTGVIEGASAGAIAAVLDTSELNVALSFGWYRMNYVDTAYGMRQMTTQELAEEMRLGFLNMMLTKAPDNAALPGDLMGIAGGAKEPLNEVSKCVVSNIDTSSDTKVSYSKTEASKPSAGDLANKPNIAGVTEAACKDLATAEHSKYYASKAHKAGKATGPNGGRNPSVSDFYTWSKDGNRKNESVSAWKSRNSDVFSVAESYGMDSCVSGSGAAKDIYSAYQNCWGGNANGAGTDYSGGRPPGSVTSPYAWNKAANEILISSQTQINEEFMKTTLGAREMQAYMQANQESANFNAPWRRLVCTDSKGADKLDANGNKIRVMLVDGSYNPACGHAVRSPIQDGLLGSGYNKNDKDNNQIAANDTRHISNWGDPISLVFSGFANTVAKDIQSGLMGIGQFATKISSEVITWSFSPILDSLGITDIIIKLIKSFRDSVFFPLTVLIIGAAALQIFFSTVRRQAYREGFTSVIFVILIFITGTVTMLKTDVVVRAAQDVPAVVEQAIIGSVFKTAMGDGDEVCTSTGSSSGNKADFGKLGETSATQSTRDLVCYNWRVFTFSPWVFGQFGAGYNQHYAAGKEPSGASSWTNTNGSLVGDAAVNMGGGVKTHNWALYQLDQLKTGNTTNAKPSIADGKINNNIYRVIDAQFGPNNGAGTETRFNEAWSGKDQTTRTTIALLSPILAIFGMVVVISYTATKIVISVVSTLMLVFLPFALLIGLFPTKRAKLKDYLLSIVGLMIQRIVLTVVIAIFFVLLLKFIDSASGSYWSMFLVGMVICMMFWMWRKSIMGYVFSSIGNPSFGSSWRNDPGAAMREWPLLKTFAQKSDNWRTAGTALGSAALGGIISGRPPVTFKKNADTGKRELGGTAVDEIKSRQQLLLRKQRRSEGFEGIRSGLEAAREVKRKTEKTVRLDPKVEASLEELFRPENGSLIGIEADLAERRELYAELANSPAYEEITVPRVASDGFQEQRDGQLLFDTVLVAREDPSTIIARPIPEDEEALYKSLAGEANKADARRYAEIDETLYDIRNKKNKVRQKIKKSGDERVDSLYERFEDTSNIEAFTILENTEGSLAKKKLLGAQGADSVAGRKMWKAAEEEIEKQVELTLTDAAGYTLMDRRKVSKMLKENLSLEKQKATIELEKNEIKEHLRKESEREYMKSDMRKAAKKAIGDMDARVKKAAEENSNGGS